MVLITVLPLNANSFIVSTTLIAIYESKPVVGSSKNINIGSVINSTPIAVLFLSPPDTPLIRAPPIFVLEHFYSLSSVIISVTLFIFSSYDPASFSFAANSRHSRTLIV